MAITKITIADPINKAGYTTNKQSLAVGQGQHVGGQGLFCGKAGAVMLRNH